MTGGARRATTLDVRAAIERNDVAGLASLLADDPSLANALIRWGVDDDIHSHPVHFVCDKLFDRTLPAGAGGPLGRVLLAAGADVDFGNGDLLNAATSLGAPDVADVLLDAGARVDLRGLFGETALHWAASIGSDHMVRRLLGKGARLDVRDDRWDATPLGWALHGWGEPTPPGDHGYHHEVVARLVRAGAAVEPEWLEAARAHARADQLAALTGNDG